MTMPVQILEELTHEKVALLPLVVLERLSPPVLSTLPPETLTLLSQSTLEAVIEHEPIIYSGLSAEALAKLRRPNRPRERLSLLDL
jgi:hypothetical protein